MSCPRQPNAEPIPGYRLIEPLGSGGFGEVWKCEAPGGLYKAIKFVYGNLNSLDVEGIRAEQELQALQRIKEVRHPFVLSLDRIENLDGELVIVMELADRSLYDYFVECQTSGLVGIPRDALLRFIRDAADALDHMNEKHNLQHLDIKPRNLFLISDRVKVADFGLVKHLERNSETGLLGGVTPLYAAPETFNGKISTSSDQYSLAIVYQELLTGQRPFNGKNPRQLAQQHLQEEPELRSLSEGERPVVARALAKDPTKRFANCLAFVRALYNAQGRARPEPRGADGTEAGQDRPKTLAETCEDIQLEQLPEPAPDESVSPAEEHHEVSQLGITMAQPESGALRPAVIVGVGSFGRRALRELRCRLLDRLGDLNKIPSFRFLYVDPDPDAVRAAICGTPEVALSRNEVYHLPLQPVAHYRRRMLDHLNEWLPREKLYSIPRSQQTQGSRALGRLAFVDNHLRFLARLRRDVQHVTHPDALYQSVSQTGLALRDSVPRLIVIAAAGGGSSGLLMDLGYGLRRLLQQLRHASADVTLFLFCGAPTDPATPKSEQANVYATLTELNHFADPTIPFAAQYGADGSRIVEHGAPFTCTYLLQAPHRGPEALRDVIAHLGSYVFHELMTPLGLRLDRMRQLPAPAGATCFRSFGTYAVWFPRGLLLRLAGRQACRRLMEEWQAAGEPTALVEVEAACARALADSELRHEALSISIEEAARATLGGTPAETLTLLFARLEEQSQQGGAEDDPGSWAGQALARVQEWVGTSPGNPLARSDTGTVLGEWRKSRLNRALTTAAEKVAEEWDKRLTEVAHRLMEHPGRRIAAAEAAVARFMQFCEECLEGQQARWEKQKVRTHQAELKLAASLNGCLAEEETGGWSLPSLFGSRSRRLIGVFLDHLAAFARQCLTEEAIAAGQMFFAFLNRRLGDRLRELDFCRQRLRHLQESLQSPEEDESMDLAGTPLGLALTPGHSPLPSTESFWEAIRQSATTRVVLPEGADDLERSAAQFTATLGPEHQTQLDQTLQDRVLGVRGGLYAACAASADLVRGLALPLLSQAAAYLGDLMPITDVAQVELAAANASQQDLAVKLQEWLVRAAPLMAGKDGNNLEAMYLLVPASDAGKAFGEEARRVVADLQLVRVPGQAHLMFCRERGCLGVEDLQRFFQPCRPAYEQCVMVPHESPHARFDIVDWIPLDP